MGIVSVDGVIVQIEGVTEAHKAPLSMQNRPNRPPSLGGERRVASGDLLFYLTHTTMRSFLSISGVAIALAYVSVFLVQIDGIASDPGLGWHLKTGALIAASGKVPRTDPFLAPALESNSFNAPPDERPWVCDQWLGDLLLYQLFSWGGWPLVYSFVVGVYLFAFWGVLGDSLVRAGITTLSVVAAGLMAWKAGQVHMIVRPVIFSVLFFAIVLRLVRIFQGAQDRSLSRMWPWIVAVCVLFTVWANIHPAFVLGLGLLGVWLATECISHPLDLAACRVPALMFLFSSIGTLLNPNGIMLHRSIFSLGASGYFMSLNQEWHPLALSSLEGVMLCSLVAISLVCMGLSSRVRSSVRLFDLLAAGLFCALTLRSVRYAPFAALTLVPLAASTLHALRWLSLPASLSLTSRVLGRLQSWEARRCPNTFQVSGTLACGGIVVSVLAPHVMFNRELGPSEELYPSGVIQALEGVGQEKKGGVVLASSNWGGFITLRLWPRYRAVIDDRNTLIGEELYRGYFAGQGDIVVFDRITRVFGVTDVVISPQAPVLNQLLVRPQWKILYRDERSVVLHKE